MAPFINIQGQTYCLADITSISEVEVHSLQSGDIFCFNIYGLRNREDYPYIKISVTSKEYYIKDSEEENYTYFGVRYIPEDKNPKEALIVIREKILELWADFKSSVPII